MPMRKNISYKKRKPSSTRRSNKYNPRKSGNQLLGSNKIVSIPGRTFMPLRLKTQLKLATTLLLSSASGVNVTRLFRGNGPQAFDVAGLLTAQPMGWDQLTVMYNSYAVLASRIVLRLNSSAGVAQKFVVTPLSSSTTTNLNYNNARVMPKAKSCDISPIGGNRDTITISNYCTTREIISLDPLADDSVQAQIGSLPVSQWYWGLVYRPIDDAATVSIYINVEIDYYVVFSDLINLAMS